MELKSYDDAKNAIKLIDQIQDNFSAITKIDLIFKDLNTGKPLYEIDVRGIIHHGGGGCVLNFCIPLQCFDNFKNILFAYRESLEKENSELKAKLNSLGEDGPKETIQEVVS